MERFGFYDYFLICGTSFVTVFLLTPLIRKFALKIYALDKPAKRKVHTKLITKLGGIAIFIGFFVSSVLVLLIKSNGVLTNIKEFLIFLLSVSLIFILGLYDDLKGAEARIKIIMQIIAALILIRMGIIIDNVNFFGFFLELPYHLAVVVTVFWFVLITNAVNLIDGIDGLAGGIVFIASMGMFFSFGLYAAHPIGLLLLCLGFAHLAFLIYNFPPAKIFMGDCGSLTAGFILAGIPLFLNHKQYDIIYLPIPILILFIPLLDVFLAVCRRLIRGKYIFQADKDHIHHFLLKKGCSQQEVLYILYSAAVILSMTALVLKNRI